MSVIETETNLSVAAGGLDDPLPAAVSGPPDAPLPPELRALSAEAWDALAARALRNDVGPLLHRRLERSPLTACPPEVRAELAEAYRRTAEINAGVYADLGVLLRALDAASIPVVVLKGAYLAEAVYGDPGLRPMNDIDVLVRKDKLDAVSAVIRGLGYTPEKGDDLEAMYDLNHHLRPFEKDGSYWIEVHWSIDAAAWHEGKVTSPFHVDLDAIWSRTVPVTLGGAPGRALGFEDLLVHLCVHASFHHGFNVRLRHLCDLAMVAWRGRDAIDWSRMETLARIWGAEKMVKATLRLVRDLLGAPIPAAAVAFPGWTAHDQAALDEARGHLLRCPERFTPEWQAARDVIDPWLEEATGMFSRGAHLRPRRVGAG